ncbi:hypothetical protein K0B96_09425 [Horticoccus luteus]|uniref:Uncharacterized protein n=1 Tax=Horticoccus luteus TaxID=2862869 RepID=A0A8F9TSM4_9BACT|nr:hypothetical protein [Horticoccus luteus]QYM77548.1 hypothetical protein K0B96_09425 [Horticoccus luteus]
MNPAPQRLFRVRLADYILHVFEREIAFGNAQHLVFGLVKAKVRHQRLSWQIVLAAQVCNGAETPSSSVCESVDREVGGKGWSPDLRNSAARSTNAASASSPLAALNSINLAGVRVSSTGSRTDSSP